MNKRCFLIQKFLSRVPARRLYNYSAGGFLIWYKCHQIRKNEVGVRTSICIFKCILKFERRVRKMARESSKTSGTEETPFLDKATQRYCLMALMNISCVLKTGPAFCNTDRSSCRETTLDRSSWDLAEKMETSDSTRRETTRVSPGRPCLLLHHAQDVVRPQVKSATAPECQESEGRGQRWELLAPAGPLGTEVANSYSFVSQQRTGRGTLSLESQFCS